MTKKVVSLFLSVVMLVTMVSVCGLVLPAAAEESTITAGITCAEEMAIAGVSQSFTYTATGLTPDREYYFRYHEANTNSSWTTVETAVADANGSYTKTFSATLSMEGSWLFTLFPTDVGTGWDMETAANAYLSAHSAVYVNTKSTVTPADGSLAAPFTTIAEGVNAVNVEGYTGPREVIVVDCGWQTGSMNFSSCDAWDEMLTIRGASTSVSIWLSGSGIVLNGPTTLDAKIGNTSGQNHLYIYSRGYDLVLGKNFEDAYYNTYWNGSANVTGGDGTVIYAGYNADEGLVTDATSGRIELGRNNNLTILGTKAYNATIYYGNIASASASVVYGDANLVIDNPNLTIKKLDIGNNGNFSGSNESQTRFNSLNLHVENIAAINLFQVNSWQGSVYVAGALQALFNNGTYDKIDSFNDEFRWSTGNWQKNGFVCSNYYILKSAATDGHALEPTATAGAFAVTGKKTANAANDTNSYYSNSGVLTVAASGEYGVTYAAPAAVYVDTFTGNDATNDGVTTSAPLKTLQAAVDQVNALGLQGDNRQVIITACGWNGVTMNFSSCAAWDEMITISCASASTTIWNDGNTITMNGPLKINAIVGDSRNQKNLTIKTRGHDLVLDERYINYYYTENGAQTLVYAGYDSAEGLEKNADTGRVELDRDNNLSILGSKPQSMAIYYGNMNTANGSVVYGDANLYINNSNLTVTTLDIGNNGNFTGSNESQTRFNSLNLHVENIAAINLFQVNSWQGSVYVAGALQALFNNGTYDKIDSFNDEFSWSTGNWQKNGFVCSNYYVIKAAAESGCCLETTDTVGTFHVAGNKMATATSDSNKVYSFEKALTLPAVGEYTVTYSTPQGIYVDANSGVDTNAGTSPAAPLKTLQAAANKLNELGLKGDNRIIQIMACGWDGVSLDFSSCTPWDEMITITTAGVIAWSTADVVLAGPLTLDGTFGNSSSQTRLIVHPMGHEIAFGQNYVDSKAEEKGLNTAVYIGYFKNKHQLSADAETGNIEFGNVYPNYETKISGTGTVTIDVNVGNAVWPDATVQYDNVRVVVDNPNMTIASFKIANAGNFKVGVSTQMNRYKLLTIQFNNVAAATLANGGTHYNGTYAETLQYLFNNGTADKVTDNITYGTYGDPSVHANVKYTLNSMAGVGALEPTETAGQFQVVGSSAAKAETASTTINSVDGLLTVAAGGTYTVTYGLAVYVDAVNGSDENTGLSASSALKTLPAALDKVNALGYTGSDRVVYLLKTLTWSSESDTVMSGDFTGCTTYTEPITIRGKNNSEILWLESWQLVLPGPITFDNIRVGLKGNASNSLYVFANGHEFKITETAALVNPVNLYAGVHTAHNNIGGDTMYMEYVGNEAATFKDVELGGYDNQTAPQKYTYKNVYLLLNNPNLDITGHLWVGYNNAQNASASSGDLLPNNRVDGNVTVVVNANSMTGFALSSHYNGMRVSGDMQLVFNNGLGDSLTGINANNIANFTVAGEQWVLRSAVNAAGCYLLATDTVGTYRVVGDLSATATNGTDTYYSKNGLLTVPAGDYTVTYAAADSAYTFANDTLTATGDITALNLTSVAPVQEGNRIFLGWTTADGTPVADITNVSLTAGEILKAVYADFNISYESGKAQFYVEGVQMRATDNQGLRFILTKSEGFDEIFANVTNVTYGYLLLPQYYLDQGQTLTIGNTLAAQGNSGDEGFRHYDQTKNQYTVCLTGIADTRYNTVYVARGYVTYTDLNGVTATVYSESLPCSLFEAAALTTTTDDARSEEDPLKLTAEQRERVLAVMETYLSKADNTRTDLVTAVPDTVKNLTGTKYYIDSVNGDDSNLGTDENNAWKSLYRLSQATLQSGDVVLFKRGGEYRVSATEFGINAIVSGVSYGAYGSGAKPIINGSVRNYKNSWTDMGNNLWQMTLTDVAYVDVDPGVIVFNNGEAVGYRRVTLDEVASNFDFFYDYTTHVITLYYEGTLSGFDSIEIGTDHRLFNLSTPDGEEMVSDILVENLDFRYSGAFGIRGKNNRNVTIRGCEFRYIGGAYDNASGSNEIENPLRYGNAIEFMESSSNILVEKCYIENIYDSGVTFQGGATQGATAMVVDNFTVQNCVIKNCGLGSFEYWMGTNGTATNVTLKDNYMEGAGCGWGGEQRPTRKYSAHISSDGASHVRNFVITNNVFNGSNYTAEEQSSLLVFSSYYKLYPELSRNIYVDGSTANLGYQKHDYGSAVVEQFAFGDTARETLKNEFGETAPIVIFTENLSK